MHDNPKQQVINAIRELGRRVTAADVATKTGLPVLVVQQKLNEVASDTSGHMQVGASGAVVYSFSPGFSNAYLAKGINAVFQTVGAKIFGVLFYLVRISFGLALILSLITVIVLLLLMALLMSRGARGGDSDYDGEDGLFGGASWLTGGFHFSFWDWMILRDLLWWNMYTNTGPTYYRYDQPTIRRRSRSNFLLNCFSFLFGDGDPNEGLQEKRWQLIAQVIKHNNNVVTAEQLAPYTGAAPSNEDAVLPVLARFNGRPEVTESGNIVYIFESLQSIEAQQKHDPPAYLQEFKWKFTNTDEGELLPVFIVAGLNLGGAWYLWHFIQQLHLEQASPSQIPSAHGFVVLVMCMVVYGTAFVAIPIIRTIINKIRNAGIEKRNIARFRYSQMLASPTDELKQKLREAYTFRIRDRKFSQEEVVYTTEKDSLDQDDDLSNAFKDMEQQDELAKHRKHKAKPLERGKTYNFAPKDSDSDEHEIISHDDEEGVREIGADASVETAETQEDEGGVIDLSKQPEKIKIPKKNRDFDANP